MFALHAGIAIENARLHEQVQRSRSWKSASGSPGPARRDHPEHLRGRLVARGPAELIDDDRPEAAARIDRAIDALHATIGDIRNFIVGLRPELPITATWSDRAATLAEEVRLDLPSIDVDASAARRRECPHPRHAHDPVLHITREALSNVSRHSQAHARLCAAAASRATRSRLEIDGQRHRFQTPTRSVRSEPPGPREHGDGRAGAGRHPHDRQCADGRHPYHRSAMPASATGDARS